MEAEKKEKMCPMLMLGETAAGNTGDIDCSCIEKDCAWWDGEGCVVMNLNFLSTFRERRIN